MSDISSPPKECQLSFHTQLLSSLDDVIEQLTLLTSDAESRSEFTEETSMNRGLWEAMNSYNFAMAGLQTFVSSLEQEEKELQQELQTLEGQRKQLSEERDVLIEKGHELNCRISYNALERKLEEAFTSIERYTSEDSAQCFKDEAEENLRRAKELTRVANMRTCQLDRDIYNQMEDITGLFQTYEKDREMYVKELDLFTDVRKARITEWLAESRTAEERERGEAILDWLTLQEKRRHLDAQVIKNALCMYSFNASMAFDREDNLRLMDELGSVQTKVNQISGVNIVLPRSTKATTDLTAEDLGPELTIQSTDDSEEQDYHGQNLHTCRRQINLATEPVTDDDLVAKLEEALRWSEYEGVCSPSILEGEESKCEGDASLTSSLDKNLAGDTQGLGLGEAKTDLPLKAPQSEIQNSTPADLDFAAMRNVESHPGLPIAVKRLSSCSMRRKPCSNRMVGSLTSVGTDGSSRTMDLVGETKSHSSEPSLKASLFKGKEWPPE